VHLVPGFAQFEARPEQPRDVRRLAAHDRQLAALRRSFLAKSADDGVAAYGNRLGRECGIPGGIGGVGEEVQSGPVMLEIVATGRKARLQDVA
jgi:hypothetical protein